MNLSNLNLPSEERSRRLIDLTVSDVMRDLSFQVDTYISEMLAKLSPLDLTIDDVVLESYPMEFETSMDMDRGYWDISSPKIRATQMFRLRLKTEEEKAQEAAQKALEADEDEIYKPAIS